MGSLKLQKNILSSLSKILGLFWITKLIFFKATYYNSLSLPNKEIKGYLF